MDGTGARKPGPRPQPPKKTYAAELEDVDEEPDDDEELADDFESEDEEPDVDVVLDDFASEEAPFEAVDGVLLDEEPRLSLR